MRIPLLVAIPVITIGYILYSGSSNKAAQEVFETSNEVQDNTTPEIEYDNTFLNEETKEVAPRIVSPQNFDLEASVFIEQKDGSLSDSGVKAVMFVDSVGDRYRMDLIDANSNVIESDVSLFDQMYKLKFTS